MPFNYFNTSYLAFGSKLTRAFKQLESLANDSENIIQNYADNLSFFSQYINRNYKVPFPSRPESPVQVNQLLDVINDEITIKELVFSDNKFKVSINYFNQGTNRFTIASGETTIKKGYASFKESVSNQYPESEIVFTENANYNGKLLFQYRIDSKNNINIVSNKGAVLRFKKGDIKHIKYMAIGDSITLPYTAQDYEAILVVGVLQHNGTTIDCSVTDGSRVMAGGTHCKRYGMFYLKPGQTLSSTAYSTAYKVIYQ